MHSPTPDGSLTAWIAELRGHVEHGGLAALGPIDFGDGLPALPAEHAVRLMLNDLDEFETMAPDEVNTPANIARRARLLADFRTLRLLFG